VSRDPAKRRVTVENGKPHRERRIRCFRVEHWAMVVVVTSDSRTIREVQAPRDQVRGPVGREQRCDGRSWQQNEHPKQEAIV
jgi:hypothetical protein